MGMGISLPEGQVGAARVELGTVGDSAHLNEGPGHLRLLLLPPPSSQGHRRREQVLAQSSPKYVKTRSFSSSFSVPVSPPSVTSRERFSRSQIPTPNPYPPAQSHPGYLRVPAITSFLSTIIQLSPCTRSRRQQLVCTFRLVPGS